jgi:hypothetical protein
VSLHRSCNLSDDRQKSNAAGEADFLQFNSTTIFFMRLLYHRQMRMSSTFFRREVQNAKRFMEQGSHGGGVGTVRGSGRA